MHRHRSTTGLDWTRGGGGGSGGSGGTYRELRERRPWKASGAISEIWLLLRSLRWRRGRWTQGEEVSSRSESTVTSVLRGGGEQGEKVRQREDEEDKSWNFPLGSQFLLLRSRRNRSGWSRIAKLNIYSSAICCICGTVNTPGVECADEKDEDSGRSCSYRQNKKPNTGQQPSLRVCAVGQHEVRRRKRRAELMDCADRRPLR